MNGPSTHAARPFLAGRRLAGIGMHLTSLPGEHGIGDMGDCARAFIDQLVAMNIGVWQYLPLGPTAYGDSPYQPLSAFAGNANLVGLQPLVVDGLLQADQLEPLRSLATDYVDYGRLIPMKRALLGQAAEAFDRTATSAMKAEYDDFQHEAGPRWLDDYALFRVLKTAHGERPWPEWAPGFARRRPADLANARDRHRRAIEQTRITQFLFHRQWRALKTYAADRGVCLFGDMPIYIALDSADAWAQGELLKIDAAGRPSHVAGVPPDYFSEDGQLWGNPLYDWGHHRDTGYAWWVERLRHAAEQNDLVRIDHFRGFEAFWSVPFGATTARAGEWLPGPGDALFEAVERALGKLRIVAEDLGVITPEVDALRERHGIPGMVVLQFEVGEAGFDAGKIAENAVCYTGTHDNDTTLGWFRGTGDDTRSAQDIALHRQRALAVTGGQPETIHLDMLQLALSSPAAIALAPMQDLLGLGSEARLNRPGTTQDNWRWRMRPGAVTPALVEQVGAMVSAASRAS
ncbi:4-alpha-glucanotransferase [Marinihelvus fidelis]|uniref:4-alpha-glucanotransferase n=1 Tax=Marinihelvus fidelis TaxID=2613842 RepID=A0A5N0THA1_9GAMM|nr:4-alpha-glucanotransferase [Marinihelvus fidelis]KAA9133517.1 4-alpha-glucanotransferase [Marinihelvus fidelis]